MALNKLLILPYRITMAVKMPQFIFAKVVDVVDFMFYIQDHSENEKNCDVFMKIAFNQDLVMRINEKERKYAVFKLSANSNAIESLDLVPTNDKFKTLVLLEIACAYSLS